MREVASCNDDGRSASIFLLFFIQPDGRRVCFQQGLLRVLLGSLQKLRGLRVGAEQLKVHFFIIWHGLHLFMVLWGYSAPQGGR